MARHRRRSYRESAKRRMSWYPIGIDISDKAYSTGKNYLLGHFPMANSPIIEEGALLERIRGGVALLDSNQFCAVTFWAVILPDIVLGSNTTPGSELSDVPTPYDSDGTDDFPLVQTGLVYTSGSELLQLDSKARRKVSKDDLLTFAFRPHSSLSGTSIGGLIRVLLSN